MGMLNGKKLLLFGEEGGISADIMADCLKDSGTEIIFSVTECPT